jgi:antitoxin ParD1/3/4
MAKPITIELGEHFEAFVQRLVDSGRYASADAVIREALRGMEAREQERARVRTELERLIDEGIESAENEPLLDHDEVFSQLRERRGG